MHPASQAELPQRDLQYVSENEQAGEAFVFDVSQSGDGSYQQRDCSLREAAVPQIPPHGTVTARSAVKTSAAVTISALALKDIAGVVSASRLERPPVPRVLFGIAQVDELTGGLPRGGLTEICGAPSSGRTSVMLSAMAETTGRGELCAVVDASDSFDPHSAAVAGVTLSQLLWIRCAESNEALAGSRGVSPRTDVAAVCSALRQKQAVGSVMPRAKVWYGRSPARSERDSADLQEPGFMRRQNARTDSFEERNPSKLGDNDHFSIRAVDRRAWARCVDHALRATDLLLQAGGFGLVIIDLGDVPPEITRRVPLTSWFRFRRAVENTPSVLLSVVRQSCAKTCASLVLEMHGRRRTEPSEDLQPGYAPPAHARLFTGLNVAVELARSPGQQTVEKKPPRPARTRFESQTEWTHIERNDWAIDCS